MLEEVGGADIKVYSGVVEPYEDLALGRLDAVLSVIKGLVKEGMTTVIATHEMDFAREVAERDARYPEG